MTDQEKTQRALDISLEIEKEMGHLTEKELLLSLHKISHIRFLTITEKLDRLETLIRKYTP